MCHKHQTHFFRTFVKNQKSYQRLKMVCGHIFTCFEKGRKKRTDFHHFSKIEAMNIFTQPKVSRTGS